MLDKNSELSKKIPKNIKEYLQRFYNIQSNTNDDDTIMNEDTK